MSSVRVQICGVKLMQNVSLLLNTVLSPAEAATAKDQDQPNLPTVSSKDVMKLSLVEDNTVILQVDEDRSSLPPPRKKRISQADVLEELHKALKLQQEMLELKKKKLRMEILLIGKELDDADKEIEKSIFIMNIVNFT